MLGTNQPAKPFLGVRFVLFGFDAINEPEIRFKLIDGGGVDAGQYSPNCTHVIVNNVVYDNPICIAARKDCKVLVSGLWVDHSYETGKAVDSNSIMYRPPKDLNGIPGAKSLVVCLTGYPRLDREDIMTLVGLMGAQFSKPLAANKVTHLICYKFEGEKYELGKRLPQIKLVNHLWLEDCLKEWEILPEANYNKSSYELEIMDAEAKDSEEEAEGTSLQQNVLGNMQKSPHRLKPGLPGANNSPKLGAETPKAKDPSNIGYLEDKFSVQGIDNISDQTSSLANVSFSKASNYQNIDALKETTYNELAQPHYQSPFRKHVTNNLSPSSRSVERPPHSDGKFNAVSYTRKTQRSLGELSSNYGGFGKEVTAKPKVDDLLSSFSKPGQAKDVGGSDFSGAPQIGNDLLSAERQTVYSPQKSIQTGSYSTPNMQKIRDDVKLCIRKSPSPSNKILGVKTSSSDDLHEASISQDALGNESSLNEGADNAKSAIDSHTTDMVNQSPCFIKSSTPKPLSKTTTSESRQHLNGNEKASPSSFKRLKVLPVAADLREPQDHQQDVKGSAAGNRDLETDGPSSLNLVGNHNSVTKLLRKKMVAKKTLGSRPKIASSANQKGSIYLEKKSTFQKDAAVCLTGQDNDKSAHTMKPDLCSPIANNEAAQAAETLDDETETPEEQVEPILENVIHKENAAALELVRETDILMEKETIMQDISNDATASACEIAPKRGRAENTSENAADNSISAPSEPKSKGDGLKRKNAREKAPAVGKSKAQKLDVTLGKESMEQVGSGATRNETSRVKEMENEKKAVKGPTAKLKQHKASKNKLEKSAEEEKENRPIDSGTGNESQPKEDAKAVKSDITPLDVKQSFAKRSSPSSSGKIGSVTNRVRNEPALFILSGHRFQRKEFQKVIRRLKGRFCRDSHKWSYEATHFIASEPIRRTEKFFAAAASGRWILKTDYLTASNEAGKLLAEEAFEWHKNGLSEDGAINLEAPRKWRLLRERTGHGVFHRMRIVIYGECILPSLDTLKRTVKAGDGTILATSPPYTRFLDSDIDFAIVSPGMPRVDMWVQEFLKHEIPCVVADYLVEYVCKPGYSLEKHVLYNSHAWAEKSFVRLQARVEEVLVGSSPPDSCGSKDDMPCKVCGSRDREEVMLICGDEDGSTGCGIGCHIDCCDPPLEDVPEDDWFCSECSNISKSSDKSSNSKRRKKGKSLSKGK